MTGVLLICALLASHVVETGSVIVSGNGPAEAELVAREKIGKSLVTFIGPWTGEKIRKIGEICRKNGLTFTMDEMFDRWTGDWKSAYVTDRTDVLNALKEYSDVCAGTQHFSETGGLLFYWHPADAVSPRQKDAGNSLAQAFKATDRQVRAELEKAKQSGLPRPYFSIECSFGFAPYLLRAGYDRVDLEVIYSDELERAYAGVKTATEAFGRPRFGADMAIEWYGGMWTDGLWKARWRNSLYHAYLRGADPIYLEHGISSFGNHGRQLGTDHPLMREFRKTLSDFTAWTKENPRADGFPCAAVAAIHGRLDGYVGVFQAHDFGQRGNDRFKVGDADRGWRLFDGLYRRRGWQERDNCGDADYSGNPPLGVAGILPFDASSVEYGKYRFLFFLGRNVMGDALYGKLVRYVKDGGTLLLAANHLTTQDVPDGAFVPYNGGDWSELVGVRVRSDAQTRSRHGMKFTANPGPGWQFQPLTNMWDPDFIEGGVLMPDLEVVSAKAFARTSERFKDGNPDAQRGLCYVNELGKGRVIFLASIEPPGAFGVRKLYAFLLSKAMEAVGRDVWPKVECSDTVRWSVYPDGTVYLLNVEAHLEQSAIYTAHAGAQPVTVRLAPGELRTISSTNK